MTFGSWILRKLGATHSDARVQICTIRSGTHGTMLKALSEAGIDATLQAGTSIEWYVQVGGNFPGEMHVYVPVGQVEAARLVLEEFGVQCDGAGEAGPES